MIHKFLIKGSAKEPYEVLFRREGTNLSAYCTCPAGKKGMHCKHRINILRGKPEGIIGDHSVQAAEVVEWVKGSDLESLLAEFAQLEEMAAKINSELKGVKKRLSRAMTD